MSYKAFSSLVDGDRLYCYYADSLKTFSIPFYWYSKKYNWVLTKINGRLQYIDAGEFESHTTCNNREIYTTAQERNAEVENRKFEAYTQAYQAE